MNRWHIISGAGPLWQIVTWFCTQCATKPHWNGVWSVKSRIYGSFGDDLDWDELCASAWIGDTLSFMIPTHIFSPDVRFPWWWPISSGMKLKHTLEGDILRICSCDFGERLSGLNGVPVSWQGRSCGLSLASGVSCLCLVLVCQTYSLISMKAEISYWKHFQGGRLVDLLCAQGASDLCTYLSHQLIYVEKADMK